MAKKSKFQEFNALSDVELAEKAQKLAAEIYELGMSIRSNQSNDLKKYYELKKQRAQVETIRSARRNQETEKAAA